MKTEQRNRIGKRPLAMVAGVVGALMVLSVAFAHAEPVATSPASGATVTALPAQVTMDTSEPMAATGSSLVVVNGAGTQVTTAASVVDPANHSRISVALPGGLPAGTYTVRWATVAEEDGHAANGSWTFTYAPAQGTPTATATATATAVATPSASATPVATTRPASTPASVGAATATPAPPKTGMGGVEQAGSSAVMLMLLGGVAAGVVFGARLATSRVRA